MALGFGVGLSGLVVRDAVRRQRGGTMMPPVACWGDSLTAGAGVTGTGFRYPAVASALYAPARVMVNEGIGGQTSTQVAARQGGVPILTSVTGGAIPIRLERVWDFSAGLSGWSSRIAANPPAVVRAEGGAMVIEAVGTPQSGAQVWLGETLPQGTVCKLEFDIDMGSTGWIEVGLVSATSASHFSGGWSVSTGFSAGGRKSLTLTIGSSLEPTANSILFMSHTRVGTYRISNVSLSVQSVARISARSVNVLTNSGAFSGTIDGTLAGVAGTMSTSATGEWSFTRAAVGPAVPVASNTPFIPAKAGTLRDHTAWIWVGRNNFANPAQVKSDIAAMVAWLGHGRYRVGSVLPSASDTVSGIGTINTLNADLAAIYGTRYVNILGALRAAGNGGAEDNADIAAGYVPRSLRSDAVHLNNAGYAVVATVMAASDQG